MAMNIPLLDPVVLRGVIEKFVTPENLVLSGRFPRRPSPWPIAQWDVIRGNRMVGKFNVPNSEAHIVPQLGRESLSAEMVYFREKKVFSPTTLQWARQPGTLAESNYKTGLLREISDLNNRLENNVELALWGMMKGSLVIDQADVQATIDYKIATSHKPNPTVGWDDATPQQIVADIAAWKRLISRDGRVEAKEAFATEFTMRYVFDSFAGTGSDVTGATPFLAGNLLSDRMKEEYYKTGVIDGFMGLKWNLVESQYYDDAGVYQLYCPDNALFLGNYTDGNPIEILEGPVADFDAPDGLTGKFAKTFTAPDPSVMQYLIAYMYLPVLQRPEQVIYCDDVTTA